MGGAEKEAGIHMVHQKEGGDYLVVAVMFEITEFGHNVEVNKNNTSPIERRGAPACAQ